MNYLVEGNQAWKFHHREKVIGIFWYKELVLVAVVIRNIYIEPCIYNQSYKTDKKIKVQ